MRLSRTLCHSCVLDVIFLTLPWWMDSERKRYANVYKHHKTAAAKHTDSVQPLPTPRIRTRNMRATRSHRRLSTPCSTIFIPAATQRRAYCEVGAQAGQGTVVPQAFYCPRFLLQSPLTWKILESCSCRAGPASKTWPYGCPRPAS